MAKAMWNLCFGLLLLSSSNVRAGLAQGIKGSVTDVGPEAGASTSGPGLPFLFRGPDEILTLDSGTGIHKTVNRAQSWMRSERGLVGPDGVEPVVLALCQSASAPEIAYATTLERGVSRTTDFGDTWEPVTSLPDYVGSCVIDPTDPSIVYVIPWISDSSRPGQLYKSTDGGRSFLTVGAGLGPRGCDLYCLAFALAVAPTNPLTVYVGHDAGLFVSFDGGLNFQRLRNSPRYPYVVYGHPTKDGTLFVIAETGLFLSTDGGESFTQIGAGLPGRPSALAFDPADPSIVYSPAGPNGLFQSVDGARSFSRIDALEESQLIGLGLRGVALTPGNAGGSPVIYAGSSLGPIRSDDGGSTFVPIHDGYRGVLVSDLAIDAAGRLLIAGWGTGSVFRSVEPGIYQTMSDTLPREFANFLTIAAAADDPELYVLGGAGPSGVFRTTNGGRSWTQAKFSDNPSFYTRMHVAFAPSDSRRVYVVADSPGGLFRSNDAGQSFDRLSSRYLTSIAVDPRDPDVLYAADLYGNGLFKSTDGGLTLRMVQPGYFSSIAVDPQRGYVYAGLQSGPLLFKSLDGETFVAEGRGLSGDRVLALAVDAAQPTRLFAWMRGGGLFRSVDEGIDWTPVDTGETLRRSTDANLTGQMGLVIDYNEPQGIYLGHTSVLKVVNR